MSFEPSGSPPVLFIVGPTASGKTGLALALAERWDMEVVSMDSRQVYRGMDIGTAKPTRAERIALAHHVVDVVDPDEPFDAARYVGDASSSLDGIIQRGKTAAVVGGTGLYMRALLDGFFRGPGRDARLRRQLEGMAADGRTHVLHERLARVDPEAAGRIHPNDVRRLVRALEVYEITGRSMTELWRSSPGRPYPCRALVLGLSPGLADLDRRIAARVHTMMEIGLVEEVQDLLRKGYSADLPSMSAVGYREVEAYIRGAFTEKETIERTIRSTCRYARRQLRWFRADARIRWLESTRPADAVGEVRRAWDRHLTANANDC